MTGKALVLGASGFLGSHIVKKLVEAGREVRILSRPSSDMSATDHLDIERMTGDVFDPETLRNAMCDCSAVYHSIVNTRAWLRDPSPLFEVNVDGLAKSMDAALAEGVERFIFTSSIATMGLNPSGVATEDDEFNWWETAHDYTKSRVAAENKLLEYCREKGLPGISMCVANTYGPEDHQPTPHGRLVALAAQGSNRAYVDVGGAAVGIGDAADAMLLAEEKGRIGERYIVSESFLMQKDMITWGAEQGGIKPYGFHTPLWFLYVLAWFGDIYAKLLDKDITLSTKSIDMMHVMNDMDASKARRELGWSPKPIEQWIRQAADYYLSTGINYKAVKSE